MLTFDEYNAIIFKRQDARVVELADSLDSGSSAHSGRAGSSPASRTKNPDILGYRGFLFIQKFEKLGFLSLEK